MKDEITKSNGAIEYTAQGKRIRASKEEVYRALAPMFAYFPGLTMAEPTFNAYYMSLCVIDPDHLVRAVIAACEAHQYPTQLVTVAAIREQLDARAPGPRTDVDPRTLPDIPQKMFRLDDEEDRKQRMERLRQTKGWNYA